MFLLDSHSDGTHSLPVELMSAGHHRLGQTSSQLVFQHLYYLITIALSPIIVSVDLKYAAFNKHLQTTDYASHP